MSQHQGPPELCLACAADRLKAIEVDQASDAFVRDHPDADIVREYRDQRVRELQQALSDHALGVESGGGNRVHEDRCPLCVQCGGYGTLGTDDLASIAHKSDCRVDRLLRGLIEADPDVADTAWAIIDHHRQHRTAG